MSSQGGKIRRYNWSLKSKRRTGQGTGRMRTLRHLARKVKNGYREGTTAPTSTQWKNRSSWAQAGLRSADPLPQLMRQHEWVLRRSATDGRTAEHESARLRQSAPITSTDSKHFKVLGRSSFAVITATIALPAILLIGDVFLSFSLSKSIKYSFLRHSQIYNQLRLVFHACSFGKELNRWAINACMPLYISKF